MRSLVDCHRRNVLNTTGNVSASTTWKSNLRRARAQKKVRSLRRQSRDASGTETPKQTLPKIRRNSLTATEKKIRANRSADPRRKGEGEKNPTDEESSKQPRMLPIYP